MISKEELDNLRQYLKYNAVPDLYNADWYSLNGLEISIDADCGTVFVYLMRDKWLVACTTAGRGINSDNPHKVIVLDFDRLMRLIDGGEMAYNNMENERILDEL